MQPRFLHSPLGAALPDWQPPRFPEPVQMTGRYVRLEPLDVGRHAEALMAAYRAGDDAPGWTYLDYGPFADGADYARWIARANAEHDARYVALIGRASGQALGVAGLIRIRPDDGVLEIGHIHYADALKGSAAATEAQFLLMQHVFALGYRRYEWKCHAGNAASRTAAARLGFRFEGVFRQHRIAKGRNRDTAWFSMLDHEWPALEAAFRAWLSPDNFDQHGRQRERLSRLTMRARNAEPGGKKTIETPTVRWLRADDAEAWRGLFQGYAAFYDKPDIDSATIDTVWRWLGDPAHPLEGLVVVDEHDGPVGLAHIRACPQTLGGTDIGFLDDLYVAAAYRGSGAADALFAGIRQCATDRGWPAVRWLTQHFNARGRGFYDRYTGGPSDFIAYHWPVADAQCDG
ncbi:GNAT family N-acetyltransferase [Salinisphaera sp. Q1T1-3]|uniref:GNAT family N-acetyltransferase n=1 Tax=Salinisphaera sp. Q1T1-3 TaxID=2321229 RepID=UPI000E750FF7|nr:GNAT family N-acetyltransferase [Salinisphaera sp. Q1T1-3]RJS93699.1 N-acetyltransferase [Salinisphaera sp. Q1T1-3]